MSTTAPITRQPGTTPHATSAEPGTQPVANGSGAPQTSHTAEQARRAHEHSWRTESHHSTSEGIVRYVRCARCGAHRVELRPLAPNQLHA
ncbi:hypothetical protein [Leucobacter aridicollis]|uniref:hypothetical protein n=1 Tax=Leucobacter aridicollis TaxID=283878 RepID=UPI002103731C|nr:hypothetical protein [Leucobacter aridicollis]UTX53670.1 hypothetical protein KI794_02670 [Leucobacter aridicollis]